VVEKTRLVMRERCGLAPEQVILSAVHTHTGPDVDNEKRYADTLPEALTDAVRHALDDLKPRAIKIGRAREETQQYIRRYRMKDGSVRTNPGIMNPDVIEPIGEPDRELLAMLVSGPSGAVGGVVNFGLHCDCIGGDLISADWTYFLRRAMSREFGRTVNILTPIAAAGDVNHWNVFEPMPTIRGFDLSDQIGSRIAMTAMEALEHAETLAPGPVIALNRTIEAPVRYPTEAELQEARIVWAQPAPTDQDFTMDRVEARRRLRAAELGESVRLDIGVIAAGNAAFVALPGEYFSELARMIRQGSPFKHTFLCTLSNGVIGYIPAKQNYAEGGYEAVSAVLEPGGGEMMAGTAIELLNEAVKPA
jgi:hypothetical protein